MQKERAKLVGALALLVVAAGVILWQLIPAPVAEGTADELSAPAATTEPTPPVTNAPAAGSPTGQAAPIEPDVLPSAPGSRPRTPNRAKPEPK